MSSKHGGGSRASDEDAKTAVKVGLFLSHLSWPEETPPGFLSLSIQELIE